MSKKITNAEAEALVQAAKADESAAALAARKELLRWTKERPEFENEATRRWVDHTVLILGLE